jgi:hypothetical protein
MFYATGLPGWARAGMGIGAAALAAGAFRGMSGQQELDVLKQQAKDAADTLENIRRRISTLESGVSQ